MKRFGLVLVTLIIAGGLAVAQPFTGGAGNGGALHAGDNYLPGGPGEGEVALGITIGNTWGLFLSSLEGFSGGVVMTFQGYNSDGLSISVPDVVDANSVVALQPIASPTIQLASKLIVSGSARIADGLFVGNGATYESSIGTLRARTHTVGFTGSETTFFSNVGTTTDATPLTLPLDTASLTGASFPNNTACSADISVVGRQDTTNRAAYKIHALYHRTTGNVTLTAQTAVSTLESNAAWAAVAAAPASAYGGVQVTGVAATTIYWSLSGTFVCVSTST